MKKYYFINKLDTNDIERLDKQTTVIYRNYSSKKQDENLVIKIKSYCKKKSIKFYLSNNIKLALKLDLDGAYIPAFNNDLKHLAYSLKKKFEIIGSAHNLKEIKIKKIQKVNKIFLSSLFKKNKNYLGIYRFKALGKFTDNNIVALGGISKTNLKTLRNLGVIGFAGISFFK